MPTSRIPDAPVRGLFARGVRWFSRRMFGQVPATLPVMLHQPQVLRAVMAFEGRVSRFDRLDPHLKTYAELAAAGVVGCGWCLDFGYHVARTAGLDLRTVSQVRRWRTSDVFDDTERAVMAYAEAVSATPPTATDEMVADLVDRLGAPAVVELTQMVALENMRSRFNSALGVRAQGYSDSCEIPLARPDDVASRA